MDIPQFRYVHVRCPRHDAMLVRWVMQPCDLDDLAKFSFSVFRSNGPAGPWDLIGEVEAGTFHFVDYTAAAPHAMRSWFYVVRIANATGFFDSKPVCLEHDPDNIALEFVRKKNVFLRARGGVPAAVLIRKRWGAKCAVCWDERRHASTDDQCRSCFGTGYAGGYLAPVFVPAALANMANQAYTEAIGRLETSETGMELANLPVLMPDDIIVDRVVNSRFKVVRVVPNTHRMHLISQVVVAVRLDDASPVYSIQLPEHYGSVGPQSFDLRGA